MFRSWYEALDLDGSGRPLPHHRVLAAAAIGISIGVHVLILLSTPPFVLGRPIETPPAARVPPIQLKTVQLEPPVVETRPRLDPERADRSYGKVPAPPSGLTTVLDPVKIEPPAPRQDLAATRGTLLPPSERPSLPEWQPRQDRIEIARRTVADDAAAIPRRIAPQADRVLAAPDVALPSLPTPAATVASTSLPPLPDADLSSAARALPPPGSGSGAGGLGRPLDPITMLTDDLRPGAERVGDITDLQPVESLLEFELQTFRPPDEPDLLYFSVALRRKGAEALPALPRDVLIVQDCSESMTQAKVEECKKGIHAVLRTLQETDRFDIMAFADAPRRCFGSWRPATLAHKAQAGLFIEQMVSRGRTDVHASLEDMLRQPEDPSRPMIAILISDGRPTTGLMDNFEIIERFTRDNEGRISAFCLGGGERANRFLLDFLGFKNRGDGQVVRQAQDIPAALQGVAAGISRPVLSNLEFRFSGVNHTDVFPRRPTHLYLDRPLVLHGRVPAAAPDAGLQIIGRSGPRRHDIVLRLNWASAKPGSEALRQAWRNQRAIALIGDYIQTRDPALLAEVRRLATDARLDLPYASTLWAPAPPFP